MTGVSQYYTDCKEGCGRIVGKGTPKQVCWQCRLKKGIGPIPKPPRGDKAGWKRYLELTKEDNTMLMEEPENLDELRFELDKARVEIESLRFENDGLRAAIKGQVPDCERPIVAISSDNLGTSLSMCDSGNNQCEALQGLRFSFFCLKNRQAEEEAEHAYFADLHAEQIKRAGEAHARLVEDLVTTATQRNEALVKLKAVLEELDKVKNPGKANC